MFRFTTRAESVYGIILNWPETELTLGSVMATPETSIYMLGSRLGTKLEVNE